MRFKQNGRPWDAAVTTSAVWSIAAVLVGLPLGLVLLQAVMPGAFNSSGPDFRPSLQPIVHLFASAHLFSGIVNTTLLGVCGAVMSTALGTALALTLALTDVRLARQWSALPLVVFAMPGYLKGLAWVLLLSPGGYLVQLGLLTPAAATACLSPAGMFAILALAVFPVPFFIVRARLHGLGGEFVDAARMASVGPWRATVAIVIPMLMPAIGLSLLTTFAEIIGDFGMANTIARSMNLGLITYNIYTAVASFPVNFAAAGAQALLLGTLVAGSVAAAALSGADRQIRFVSGRSRRPVLYRLGRSQGGVLALLAILAIVSVILPLSAIVGRALTVSLAAGLTPDNVSLSAFKTVFDLKSEAGAALQWSIVYALVTAALAVGFSFVFAYRVSLASRTTRLVTAGVALTTVAIPGVVMAFGYILVYDRLPGFADLPLYGSRALLVVGYTATSVSSCVIFIWAALDRLAPSLTDAARIAGASPWRHLLRIVAPLTAPALAVAFGVTAMRALFELPMSQFLVPTAGPALPFVIVQDFVQDNEAVACALALVALLLIGALALPALLLKQRRSLAQVR